MFSGQDFAARATDNLVLKEIFELHDEIMAAARTSLEKAIRLGELLKAKQGEVGYGNWQSWLADNRVPFTDRTARNYMRLFDRRELLRSENVSDLSFAYQKLSEGKFRRKPSSKPAKANFAAVEDAATRRVLMAIRAELRGLSDVAAQRFLATTRKWVMKLETFPRECPGCHEGTGPAGPMVVGRFWKCAECGSWNEEKS